MSKKIVLKYDSGNLAEVDLKTFIDHIDHYIELVQTYMKKEVTSSQLTKHLEKN